MTLSLTKYCNTVLTIIIVPRTLFPFLTVFGGSSGVHLEESNNNQFHYRHVVFSSHLKSKVGHILVKVVSVRINLNIVDTPVASTSHTHPSLSNLSPLNLVSISLALTLSIHNKQKNVPLWSVVVSTSVYILTVTTCACSNFIFGGSSGNRPLFVTSGVEVTETYQDFSHDRPAPFTPNSNLRSTTSSPRTQDYVLTLT